MGDVAISDAELVEAVLSGRASAFGDLYDRHASLVRALCYDATGDRTHMHDLTQETFLRVHRKLGLLRNGDSFGPWLVAITRNVCREWRRQRGRDRHRFTGVPVESGGVHHDAPPDEDTIRLHRALATLPEKQRLAIHLHYLEGQSPDRSCQTLNVSRSGFYHLLRQARQQLKQMLSAEQEIER